MSECKLYLIYLFATLGFTPITTGVQTCIQNGTVHLTYDDGPYPVNTEPVLELLKSYKVSATFFINGANYPIGLNRPKAKAILRRAIRDGHTIAHHTWSHLSLVSATRETIFFEMETLSDKIYEILGLRPTLMRPPYGEFNDTVVEIVHGELGYEMVLWSLCSCDSGRDIGHSLQVYRNALEGTDPKSTPGFIALHHDTLELQVELTKAVIKYVRSKGYKFVSLHECLGIQEVDQYKYRKVISAGKKI